MRHYFLKYFPTTHYLSPKSLSQSLHDNVQAGTLRFYNYLEKAQSPFQETLREWGFAVRKLVILGFILSLTSCQQNKNHQLTIAAASNMQFAIAALTTAFTQETGIACQTVISSSGKLTAQIKENAPYDILVSANMKYPNDLFSSGYSKKKPKVYAYGKLVLWSMIDDMQPSIKVLLSDSIKHIAIANPKTAPYGAAAIEVLKYQNIYEDVKHKLVYGESISQTNQFILSQSAEIGFTAKSVLLSTKMKGKGRWVTLDDSSYSPISQGVVLIKPKGTESKEAKQFYIFLFSMKAKDILKTYGYMVK